MRLRAAGLANAQPREARRASRGRSHGSRRRSPAAALCWKLWDLVWVGEEGRWGRIVYSRYVVPMPGLLFPPGLAAYPPAIGSYTTVAFAGLMAGMNGELGPVDVCLGGADREVRRRVGNSQERRREQTDPGVASEEADAGVTASPTPGPGVGAWPLAQFRGAGGVQAREGDGEHHAEATCVEAPGSDVGGQPCVQPRAAHASASAKPLARDEGAVIGMTKRGALDDVRCENGDGQGRHCSRGGNSQPGIAAPPGAAVVEVAAGGAAPSAVGGVDVPEPRAAAGGSPMVSAGSRRVRRRLRSKTAMDDGGSQPVGVCSSRATCGVEPRRGDSAARSCPVGICSSSPAAALSAPAVPPAAAAWYRDREFDWPRGPQHGPACMTASSSSAGASTASPDADAQPAR
jgi:hypothetical protein